MIPPRATKPKSTVKQRHQFFFNATYIRNVNTKASVALLKSTFPSLLDFTTSQLSTSLSNQAACVLFTARSLSCIVNLRIVKMEPSLRRKSM
jgi:hypothetical protein